MIGRPGLAGSLAIVLGLATGCRVQYVVPLGDGESDGGCDAELVWCGALCVDLDDDPDHCGHCGNACAIEDVCDDGECESSCSDGRDVCDQRCVDLDHDPVNCGTCGNLCGETESCEDGACRDSCGGACDSTLEICVGGACACRPGLEPCSDACVDTRTNANHCGACHNGCEGAPCGDSACQPAGCDAFPDQCGSACTDVSTDPLHCGQCDHPCAADELCAVGQCEPIDSG